MELTERNIKAATAGQVLRDADIAGLHLKATATRKAFYLYFRTKAGVERRPKLGDWGAITLTQARSMARNMLAQVALGADPSAERKAARAEATVAELWEEYWKRHGSKKKSAAGDKGNYDRYLLSRFGSKKLSAIGYTDVADLIESLADKPYQANRVLALLSKMFNFAMRPLEWTEKNPCKGVARYKEEKRKRYMKGEEPMRIAELLDTAKDDSPASVAFIYLLILTGARKSEIANAKWEYLDGSVLRLPDSKTGYRQIYLPEVAVDILRRLPRTTGTITGIGSPKKLWERIRKEAGAPDLRLHDLRHSFASAALAAGLSLSQIGELLGHRSTQTTKRYAHLIEDAAAAAATITADRIMSQMSAKEKDVV